MSFVCWRTCATTTLARVDINRMSFSTVVMRKCLEETITQRLASTVGIIRELAATEIADRVYRHPVPP
jgi:hypothetical protein